MPHTKRYDPNLLATLNMLSVASILGFLYCLMVLLHGSYFTEITSVILYMIWFGICWLSVTLMKQDDPWGAHALGTATIAITIHDVVNGVATIGGAILGTLVMIIVTVYLLSRQAQTDDDAIIETRLTN
ncbi:MAG: hypothetical protein ACFE0Q_01335 [Anaerolineae bacterium]